MSAAWVMLFAGGWFALGAMWGRCSTWSLAAWLDRQEAKAMDRLNPDYRKYLEERRR